jgi:2-polyprenyl-6-methoxyphenol hydroxylase-like FAD-dependent oxidoreductase
MLRRRQVDVLVVGAGPVGLFTALELVERGVSVQIVDKSRRPAAHSYALALHPRTLDMLDAAGLAGPMLQAGYRIERISFYDGKQRQAGVDMTELSADHRFLLVLPQNRFEELLLEALAAKGVEPLRNHRVSRVTNDAGRVEAQVDKLEHVSTGYATATMEWVVDKSVVLEPRYLIGADGHRSLVRQQLGAEFVKAGDAQQFAVFEFDAEFEAGKEARVVFGERTTNVLWPLPDGAFRFSFEVTEGAAPEAAATTQLDGEAYAQLSEAHLRDLLRERAPWFDAEPRNLRWSVRVRFEKRLAERFGEHPVWLIGDAAHLTGPVGIMSMNVGFREGSELAALIAGSISGKDDPAAFEKWGKRCHAEWERLIDPGAAASVAQGASEWIRATAPRMLECLPASGSDLDVLAKQLGVTLDRG